MQTLFFLNFVSLTAAAMVLLLDGNSEHVAHVGSKLVFFEEEKNYQICDFCRFNQIPLKDQITEIISHVHTNFGVTIY